MGRQEGRSGQATFGLPLREGGVERDAARHGATKTVGSGVDGRPAGKGGVCNGDREGTRSARHLPYRDPYGIAVFGWRVENPRLLKGSPRGAECSTLWWIALFSCE